MVNANNPMTATRHFSSSLTHERGLSLIELMIAMAIGLLLVVTIGFAYVGARSSFKSQSALSRVQENARYAFEFIGTDIRMAGFNGGPNDTDPTQPVGWSNEKDLANLPLLGYEEGVSAFPAFPVGRPHLRGDALTVVHVDTDKEYLLDSTVTPNPSASSFTLAAAPGPAAQIGGIFVGADYTHAAAFAVTAVANGGKTLTTADSLAGYTGAQNARRVFPLMGATYYIATNASGEPALYRLTLDSTGGTTAEELVEGVQDMQITYGVDTSSLAAATGITAASWASNRITFTSAGHGLLVGDWVTIAGVTPSGYNGYYKVEVVPDADTFSVTQATAPGAFTSAGTAQKASDRSIDVYRTADQVTAGTGIPGPATQKNYWQHVLSVRLNITLTTRQTENVSTTGGLLTKSFTTTFAVRNRL